ncbi:MAG: hypothetical protein PVG30_04455 [Gammaproteobacteria bacterium]|jgi:AAA+ ATPase superfamily predicted ATPase
MKDYFPLKLAQGDQFCNRAGESRFLKDNIAKCRHVVLVSPRRYGKSSLVHQVCFELKMPFASVDLFLAHDDRAITKRILQGISEVVTQIMPPSEKLLASIQTVFKHFRVTLAARSFNIEASYDAGVFDPVDQVFNSLQALAKLAKNKKKRVLFFVDEFQDIADAGSSKSIQGAIRHVAQKTSNVVFIFSGSNRHLLLELFDDKSMPLYMLCDKLDLERMSSEDYWPHIQRAAQKKWKKKITKEVFELIMAKVELHPFYVNMLCSELWLSSSPPDMNAVYDAWLHCFEKEERRLVAELEKLTNNQQNLLKALALNPIIEPTGQKFLTSVGMAYSSIRQTIKSLAEKDMIYKIKKEDIAIPNLKIGQIRVLDPLLAFALRKYG